jgi:putative endonuclease
LPPVKRLEEKTFCKTVICPSPLLLMYYVYIIKSKKYNIFYVGCTGDLRRRVNEHNTDKSFYTKNKGPWEIKYYEAFCSKEDAFFREKQLKRNARGFQELRKRLKNSLL